jgi:hypothetical protein
MLAKPAKSNRFHRRAEAEVKPFVGLRAEAAAQKKSGP